MFPPKQTFARIHLWAFFRCLPKRVGLCVLQKCNIDSTYI